MMYKMKRWAMFTVIFGGGIMALSGDWRSPMLWTFVAGMSALVLYAMTTIETGLARERFSKQQGFDPIALLFIRLTAIAAVVIAPLDSGRFHWSPVIPDPVRIAAMAGSFGALLLAFRAMTANRFFAVVIRIQNDRGHKVVDAGPYAVIRHPGYAGMIIGVPLMMIALGSLWSFVLASAYALLILRRVVVEDRFLHEHLPGYVAYTARVKSRLLPGIW